MFTSCLGILSPFCLNPIYPSKQVDCFADTNYFNNCTSFHEWKTIIHDKIDIKHEDIKTVRNVNKGNPFDVMVGAELQPSLVLQVQDSMKTS